MMSVVFWIGFVVLLFWAVGAYKRLMRLRARVAGAFAALDAALVRQLVWVQGSLPMPTPAEDKDPAQAAWRCLLAASERLAQSLAAVRQQVFDTALVGELTAAHCVLNRSWQGVESLGQDDSGGPPSDELSTQHAQLLDEIRPLCDVFNQAVRAYNNAIGQFPALLLAAVFRLRRAGLLLPMALVA